MKLLKDVAANKKRQTHESFSKAAASYSSGMQEQTSGQYVEGNAASTQVNMGNMDLDDTFACHMTTNYLQFRQVHPDSLLIKASDLFPMRDGTYTRGFFNKAPCKSNRNSQAALPGSKMLNSGEVSRQSLHIPTQQMLGSSSAQRVLEQQHSFGPCSQSSIQNVQSSNRAVLPPPDLQDYSQLSLSQSKQVSKDLAKFF